MTTLRLTQLNLGLAWLGKKEDIKTSKAIICKMIVFPIIHSIHQYNHHYTGQFLHSYKFSLNIKTKEKDFQLYAN